MADTLVLCYHAVSETFPADLSATPQALHDQLALLHRRGYRGVTFTEAVTQPAQGRRVAVTFDDAFASVETLGKPILDELGWPATMFAVSEFAAGGRPLSWDGVDQWHSTEHASEMASLDWDRLRALRDAGWEIGSHTATHPHLTSTDDEQVARELAESRAAVEAEIGACAAIAYPYGDVDARVLDAAAKAGYRTGAGLPARWPAEQPLDWPRAGIYHGDDLRRFRLKTSPWMRRSRRRLRR